VPRRQSAASSVEQIRKVRENLFATGSVVARPDGRLQKLFPVAIGIEEGLALCEWVRREHALQTLETGLGYGVATLFICEGLLTNGETGRHVAIDPYQHSGLPSHRTTFDGVGLQILEDAGVRDLVEFHAEESHVTLPRLLAERRRFDLAFLDGNHRFEGVFLDLIYVARLLEQGSIVFVDDVQLPGVRRAVDFCVANLDWVIEDTGAEGDVHEWMVLRTGPSDRFFRPIEQLADF
jgi:predicted O-methyltransferase YrrM